MASDPERGRFEPLGHQVRQASPAVCLAAFLSRLRVSQLTIRCLRPTTRCLRPTIR
jgi:hypothetical protein